MDRQSELIQQIQHGEADAVNELLCIIKPTIKAYIHPLYHDVYHANAILQEVNEAVWQNIGGFNGDSEFSTWLYPLVKRIAVAYIHKNKLPMRITFDITLPDNFRMILPEQKDGDNPLSLMLDIEKMEAVRAAIKLLPELQGKVIHLRYIVGCSIEETAVLMERRSESSVKSLTSRGIAGLSVLLEAYKGDY